jgi:hypothetical protein
VLLAGDGLRLGDGLWPGDGPWLDGRAESAGEGPPAGHRSMCRLIRLRISTFSCPSQSSSSAPSASQSPRPDRATSSAPIQTSSWARARESRACAWLRETPSTAAISATSSSCRSCSWIRSCSLAPRPRTAERSSARSSARSAPGRLAQQGAAVRVQRCGVPVIGFGQPVRVTGHYRRSDLAVVHMAIEPRDSTSGQYITKSGLPATAVPSRTPRASPPNW